MTGGDIYLNGCTELHVSLYIVITVYAQVFVYVIEVSNLEKKDSFSPCFCMTLV